MKINDSHCGWLPHLTYNPYTDDVFEMENLLDEAQNIVRHFYNISSPTPMGPLFFDNYFRNCIDSLEVIDHKTGSWIMTAWVDRWTHKVLAKFVNRTQDEKSPLAQMLAPIPK
jgi:hypothetical protein